MESLDQGSRLAQLKPRVFHRFLLLYRLCKLQPSGAFAQSTQTGPPSFPPLNGVEMDEDPRGEEEGCSLGTAAASGQPLSLCWAETQGRQRRGASW